MMELHDEDKAGMWRLLGALLEGADVAAALMVAAEIADPLCLTGSDGLVEWANPAFRGIQRSGLSSLAGRSAAELLGVEEAEPRLHASLRGALASGTEFRGAWTAGAGPDDRRRFELHVRPVRDRWNHVRGFVWWIRDRWAPYELERRTLLDRSLQQSLRRVETTLAEAANAPDDGLPAVLREVGTALGASHACVVPSPGSGVFRAREWTALKTSPILPALQSMDAAELERWSRRVKGPPLIALRDCPALPLPDFAYHVLARAGCRALLLLPLAISREFAGYLALGDARGPRNWTPEETAFFRAAAGMVEREAERRVERRNVEQRIALLERSVADALCTARTKEALLAELAHEVRSPMTAILGYAELLGRHGGSRELVEDWVRQLRRNADHVVSVVDDVLHLARAESGRLEPRPEPVELVPLVQEVSRSAAAEARGKGLAFRLTCAAGVPRAIHTDRAMLQRILRNLLTNAVRFTDEGEVRLSLSAVREEGGPVTLRAEIRDTGSGIPPDMLERVFEPFLQLPGPGGAIREGTGLGLAIARRYARLLGGDITVSSEPGSGSRFALRVEADSPHPEETLVPGEIAWDGLGSAEGGEERGEPGNPDPPP